MATEYGGNTYNKYGQPSLDLVFTGPKKSLKNRVGNQQVEFTRDTIGTYIDENGIIKTAVADEARFEKEGLLIEESRTNLHPNSTVYALNEGIVGLTQGSTSTINPTGATSTVETWTVSSDVSAQAHAGYRFYNNTYVDFTWSLFVKADGINRIQVSSSQRDNSSYIDANLATGEIEAQTDSRATLTKLANGWYRISVSRGSNRAHGPGFWLLDDSGNRSFVGDGTSGVYVWGMQLEQAGGNLFPSSLTPTTGSAITRAADVAQINPASPYLYGTFLAKYKNQAPDNFSRQIFSVGNSNAYGAFLCRTIPDGRLNIVLPGVMDLTSTTNIENPNSLNTVATRRIVGDYAVCLNGGPVATTSKTNDQPNNSVITFMFGTVGGAKSGGHISRLSYYSRRLSDSELQTITL